MPLIEQSTLQQNDYSKKVDVIAPAVKLVWLGHGGSAPRDWRARGFLVRFREDVLSAEDQRVAKANKWVVARSTFICAGRHSLKPKLRPITEDGTTIKKPKKGNKAQEKKPPKAYRCTGQKGHNVQIVVCLHRSVLM